MEKIPTAAKWGRELRKSSRLCRIFGFVWAVCCGLSCVEKSLDIPENYTATSEPLSIYPDYRSVTVPPNIAPLNFLVRSPGIDYVAVVGKEGAELVASAKASQTIQFEVGAWHRLLDAHRGDSLQLTVYARSSAGWVRYPACSFFVAPEEIDPYVAYRLIEPGYSYYRQLGLYQRCIENFNVSTLYENNRRFHYDENHCVNCHSFQQYGTDRMLFHVRTNHAGTVLVQGDEVRKLTFPADSVPMGAVYPAWHPTQDWIAFSSNRTGQAFHMQHEEKVEVMDRASDLFLYDAAQGRIQWVCRTDSLWETFPAWSPAGDYLYYAAADARRVNAHPDSISTGDLLLHYPSIRYDILRLPFDVRTRKWGSPERVVDSASRGKSATLPRVSPDGRYLLYTEGDYGQFHIWHKSADLWVKDLQTGEAYPLREANSNDADSYHAWSSNGRWIVFSSRRDDGSYTRLYIAYFDAAGQAHKAFLLPQCDPAQNLLLLKSYNVPELTREPVRIAPETFRKVIYEE